MDTDETDSHSEDAPLVVRPVESDEAQIEPTPEPEPTPPAVEVTGAADTEPRTTWLTADWSERFGPAGHFLDLTAAETAEAEEGVLVAPTPEQLSMRLR